ncbi:hypothetical protein GA0070618_6052 [Micromonospora echinospora]|uniref:Uncharacterized protein n=1 Tax=Micromonospora echinospora TaxID=1877 RepID=A0A1C5A078_MICEC|nr:hypothetical protein GA0070618_6052 [Micromonospora echinospora]
MPCVHVLSRSTQQLTESVREKDPIDPEDYVPAVRRPVTQVTSDDEALQAMPGDRLGGAVRMMLVLLAWREGEPAGGTAVAAGSQRRTEGQSNQMSPLAVSAPLVTVTRAPWVWYAVQYPLTSGPS